MTNHLSNLFNALQDRLSTGLNISRSTLDHPTSKGIASELNWLTLLNDYLPIRYHASNAFVIDSEGSYSNEIDIVIYDHYYTPFLLNENNQRVIPAESVYAIFEVKQKLNKSNVEYAAEKARSVRNLVRTSAPITHAGGEYKPRSPIPILAGILTYQSDWKPPFGDPFINCLRALIPSQFIDLGCVVKSGGFEVVYDTSGSISLNYSPESKALVHFLLRLLHRLQRVGTVTAIDYDTYSSSLFN